MARIKNRNVTPERPCSCGSWLRHWEKYSGQSLACCVEINCTGKDLVGAYVQKANSTDTGWYIIPLCKTHSEMPGELEVSDNYRLVSADKMETCDSVRYHSNFPHLLLLSESPRNY